MDLIPEDDLSEILRRIPLIEEWLALQEEEADRTDGLPHLHRKTGVLCLVGLMMQLDGMDQCHPRPIEVRALGMLRI
jgi:hypothetical protein